MSLLLIIHLKFWWGLELFSTVVLLSSAHNYLFFFFLQAFIVLSCLISVSVNFSTFLVIGKTSPVTYQVLGHLKTCLVLAFGYVLLRDPFSWRNILGILVAIVGMGLYSYYCTLESQQKATAEAAQISQVLVLNLISVCYNSSASICVKVRCSPICLPLFSLKSKLSRFLYI